MLNLKVITAIVLAACINLSCQENLLNLKLQTTTTDVKTSVSGSNKKPHESLAFDRNEAEKLNIISRQFIPNKEPIVTVVQSVSPIKPFLIEQPVVSWTGEVIIENTIGGN